ncbi:MAG: FIST C-terminal domain-containing protein [Myxococcales bacterium]|nr:FIST C-terminal domain-containing protein [Myxococcales bacterium]
MDAPAPMRWSSVGSDAADFQEAITACAEGVARALETSEPDLVMVFVSPAHRESYLRIPDILQACFPSAVICGCSGAGVIGGGEEIEQRPGFALVAARLPDVITRPFHIDAPALASLSESPTKIREQIGLDPEQTAGIILLAEPFTGDTGVLLHALDRGYPTTPKIGGIASGGGRPGHNVLYADGEARGTGVAGVALGGAIEVDTIVAQGCRPIGAPLFVTRSRDNVIHELDGRRPVEALQDLYEQLSPRDQRLTRDSLFLGIATRRDASRYGPGDFLVRNIIGLDPKSGALAVGTLVATNLVVQFHVRDAETSAADLADHLGAYRSRAAERPAGALLFSCLGRGEQLYGRPNHDTEMLSEFLGPVPVGGFFCNGEIGPVHTQTHLHGYTSAFGLFRRP